LDARQLTDAAIIVVRYFGGTLLGVPGLIHAYKSSAALALQVNTLVEKPILEPYLLEFDYTLMNEVMTVLKRYPCVIRRQEMQLFCQMDVGIPRLHADNCLRQLGHIFGVTVAPAGTGKGSAK
jgi:putative IMPACT (imprinted ancient) family translation regulator